MADPQPSIMPRLLPISRPPEVTAITGNSRITAGVSPGGVITQLHWPSPGYYDQIRWRPWSGAGPPPLQGLVWGFRFAGEEVQWLDNLQPSTQTTTSEAGVITQRIELSEGLALVHRCFAHHEYPILFSEVTIQGRPELAPEIFWYGGLAPSTRVMPQAPLGNSLFEQVQALAVFEDMGNDRAYHLAEDEPDTGTRAHARRLAESEASPAEWSLFDGTVAGYTTITGFKDFAAVDSRQTIALRGDPEVLLAGPRAAGGAASSLVAMEPRKEGDNWHAAVILAVSGSRQEVDRLLDHGLDQDLDALAETVKSVVHARQVLVPGVLIDDPAVIRAAHLLRLCTDAISDAIVRAPIALPPLDLDEPRVGVWLSHAMDLLGWREQAQAHLEFYGRAVRAQSSPARPFGSLPAALYTDGTEASPPFILLTDAPAWFLSACLRHGQFLTWSERRDFFNRMAEPMARSMDFLARWTLNPQRIPLASFDAEALRETRDVQWLVLAYMGLDSGLQALRTVDQDIPEAWISRHRELQAALRFHVLNAEGIVRASPLLPYWLRGILAPEDRVWDLRLATPEGPVLFRDAKFPGSAWTDETSPWPDALQAACYVIEAVEEAAHSADSGN